MKAGATTVHGRARPRNAHEAISVLGEKQRPSPKLIIPTGGANQSDSRGRAVVFERQAVGSRATIRAENDSSLRIRWYNVSQDEGRQRENDERILEVQTKTLPRITAPQTMLLSTLLRSSSPTFCLAIRSLSTSTSDLMEALDFWERVSSFRREQQMEGTMYGLDMAPVT